MCLAWCPVAYHCISTVIDAVTIFVDTVIVPVTSIYYRVAVLDFSAIELLPLDSLLITLRTDSPETSGRHCSTHVRMCVKGIFQCFETSEFDRFRSVLPGEVVRICHFEFLFSYSGLGCDEDDTECRFRTVDGGGCRILKH